MKQKEKQLRCKLGKAGAGHPITTQSRTISHLHANRNREAPALHIEPFQIHYCRCSRHKAQFVRQMWLSLANTAAEM